MPIQVTCPSCSKQMRAQDAAAGKAVRCPGCSQVIQIPVAEMAAQMAVPAQMVSNTLPQSYMPAPQPAKPGNSSNTALVIALAAIGGAVFVMVLVVVAAFFWLSADVRSVEVATADAAAAHPPVQQQPAVPTPATPTSPAVTPTTPAAPAPAIAAANVASAATPPTQAAFGWPLAVDAPVATWNGGIAKADAETGWTALFPSAPVPVAAIAFASQGAQGSQTWNMASSQQIGAIQQETIKAKARAISPDGSAIAMINADSSSWHKVEVWSYQAGNQLAAFDVDQPGKRVTSIALPSATRLLAFSSNYVDGKAEKVLRLFDVEKGQAIASHAFDEDIGLPNSGLSGTGKYLATVTGKGELSVFDTSTLKVVAYTKIGKPQYSNLGGLAFNYAGDRLACSWTAQDNTTQIVTIDVATGESKIAAKFVGTVTYSPLTGGIYTGRGLQWLPDDSGWLVSGQAVVDATSGRVLWYVATLGERGADDRWAVPGGILVQTGKIIQRKLHRVPVAWGPARDVLGKLDDPTATLRPGTTVAIEVEIGKLRHGKEDESAATLKETLKKRLEADGFVVADEGATVTLKAHYEEEKGELARDMRDRSVTVQTTNAKIKLEWRAGDAAPFRTLDVAVDPRLLRVRESTPKAYREALFEKAQKQLASAPFPYLAIGDVVLPGVSMFE